MIKLSSRLDLIASLVPRDSRVCDVGTDHGYLSAALLSAGKVKSVIATDIREKPLESARKNLQRFGINGVSLRLCDGLDGVSGSEADCVVIAGMGGEVISGIIERAPWLKNGSVTLILQPMTAADDLRAYLADNGFNLKSENAVSDNGKVYTVMTAVYDGIVRRYDDFYLRVGELKPLTDDDVKYLIKQYKICKKCADDLTLVPEMGEKAQKFGNTAEKIKILLGDNNGI